MRQVTGDGGAGGAFSLQYQQQQQDELVAAEFRKQAAADGTLTAAASPAVLKAAMGVEVTPAQVSAALAHLRLSAGSRINLDET